MSFNATLLKDRLNESRLARQAYARVLSALARAYRMRGALLPELQLRMRAVRTMLVDGVDERSEDRLRSYLQSRLFSSCEFGPIAQNRLLTEYVRSSEARQHRRFWNQFPVSARVRMRFPRAADDPERQGDLVVLKPWDSGSGERGVLLISFTERIREFAALFDVPALASRYQLVLQPSWWGYADTTFLFYLARDLDVLVQCPWARDFEYIARLRSNLTPTSLGAGDWIDPDMFAPDASQTRRYDLVMVSSWNPVKRHLDLFRALAELKRRGRTLRVALVGFPNGWTRSHIENLARSLDVIDFCTIVESIPHPEVATIVRQARGYILLSRREGANRALYEALFCDTPVLVSRRHQGVNLAQVHAATGLTFTPETLPDTILQLLDGPQTFRPRQWALQNTGYRNATRQLNDALRALAARRNLPFETDIVETKMAPTLRYATAGQAADFEDEFKHLANYLRPD